MQNHSIVERVLAISLLCFIAVEGCTVVKDGGGINAAVAARTQAETWAARMGDYGKESSSEFANAKASYTAAVDAINPWLDGIANDVELQLCLNVPASDFTLTHGPKVDDFLQKARIVPGIPHGAGDSVTEVIDWIVGGIYRAAKEDAARVARLVRAAKWKSFDEISKGHLSSAKPPEH